MKRIVLGAVLASAMLASAATATETRGMRGMDAVDDVRGGMMRGMMGDGAFMGMASRLSPDDASAMMDAHIAALHAGLRLSAEQEKLWPPVEQALRELAALHMSHMRSMRDEPRGMRDDPIDMLQRMTDRMSQGVEALRKLGSAAGPLYATLDDAQKRRLPMLMMGLRARQMPNRMQDRIHRWFNPREGMDDEN